MIAQGSSREHDHEIWEAVDARSTPPARYYSAPYMELDAFLCQLDGRFVVSFVLVLYNIHNSLVPHADPF